MTTPNYLYRVVETTYSAGVDEYGGPLPGGSTYANLIMVPVYRETPQGWWVPEDRSYFAGSGLWRWVSKTRTIPYACLTVDEAVAAWRRRLAFRTRRAEREIARLREASERMGRQGFYSDQRRWTDPEKPDALVQYEKERGA